MRIVRILAGFVLLVLGVAMLVLPGPGWLAIIAALALLGHEFQWARDIRERVMRIVRRTVR